MLKAKIYKPLSSRNRKRLVFAINIEPDTLVQSEKRL